jgi:enterobactin synthetase component D
MKSNIHNSFIMNASRKIIPRLDAACFQCNFLTKNYSNTTAQLLLAKSLPASIDRAVTKRKAEFVAGRYLAKLALTTLLSKETHVGIKNNRIPEWPLGFTGAISHTNGFAICAIAHKYVIKSIGIDTEEVVTPETADDISNYVLLDSEKGIVCEDLNLLTLAFSAKESLFKALYPEVGFYFGFECAEITMINQRTNSFKIQLLKNLTSDLKNGNTFDGFFEFENGRVITSIFISAV